MSKRAACRLVLCLGGLVGVLGGAVRPAAALPSGQGDRGLSVPAVEEFVEGEQERGAATSAIMIMRDGKLVHESYRGEGFSATTSAKMYSVSKTVTALAIGAAVRASLVGLDDSICDLVPSVGSEWCSVSLIDVLKMRSGVVWSEKYGPRDTASDVLQMLFGNGALDHLGYVLGRPRLADQERPFTYSSGDSIVLAGVLRQALGSELVPQWLLHSVFEPMGLDNVTWERDEAGTIDGASGLFLTAPQMMQIGQVLFAGGVGPRGMVVSSEFHRLMTTATDEVAYGLQLWLNRAAPQLAPHRAVGSPLFPAATPGTYAAVGHFGQYIVVIPEEQTIIVRIGDDRNQTFDINGLIARVRGLPPGPRFDGASGIATGASSVLSRVAGPMAVPAPVAARTSEGETAQADLALGFAALTYCSCREVSRLPEGVCSLLSSPPGVAQVFVWQPWPSLGIYESLLGRMAKMASHDVDADAPIRNVGAGCHLVDAASYPVP